MCKWIKFFVYSFVLMLSHSVLASDIQLRNLRWDWEVYDNEVEHFVPYFKQNKTEAIRFEIDLNKYRGSTLKLVLPGNYFVWIDGKLVMDNLQYRTTYMALDSLNRIYAQSRISMTIYSDTFNGKAVETSIVNTQNGNSLSSEVSFFLQRKNKSQLDIFIIISIATLSLIALFRAFNNRLFQEYFSLTKSLQVRQNFDLITAHAPVAWPNIGFIIFYAILIGATVMNFGLFHTSQNFDFPLDISSTNSIPTGLKVSLVCFVLMIGKILLVTLGSELFNLSKIKAIHFFAYFRLSLIMAMLSFVLSLINGIFDGALINENWYSIQIIVLLAWSGRFILIFFVLNKIYTFRKLHLFSYLCSSELIPLLLFFKIFLK